MRALLLLLALTAPVAAEPRESIAVASADPSFTTALEAALASAGMAVVTVATWQPSVADLTDDARKLADDQHATATIALVFGQDDATLLAYDRSVDRTLVRTLPYRAPLSDAQSAEIARMARAMLRALRVTPDLDLAPPHASEAAAIRERAAAASVGVAPLLAPERLALVLGAGARLRAAGARATESGSIGAVWRPQAPGAALAATFVPAASVAAVGFTGSLSDVVVAATARVPLRVAPRVVVAGEAGLALHRFHLGGDLAGAPVDVTRYDPALRAGVTASLELRQGLAVGVEMSAEGMLRYQDYTVGGVQVLDVPVAQATIAVSLMVGIL